MAQDGSGTFRKLKDIFIGRALTPHDPNIFHNITLVAFFAWIGLGSDGLSSSCYGPEEAFLALGAHPALGIFVALLTGLTIVVLSMSYSQIIEQFPAGGGGYLVASKLLTPGAGVVAGSALIIDYILTISLSIASGADAIFSFLPEGLLPYRFAFAVAGVVILAILNMRGVKESITVLLPVFMTFLVTHAVILTYGFFVHAADLPAVASSTVADMKGTISQLGLWGAVFLVFRAYSMGAGTFTGIEAVSNGMSTFKEPRVQNAKKTMAYMAASLTFMVLGVMFCYVLLGVRHVPGKTLNAVLLENITAPWGGAGYAVMIVTLVSEAALLFVAAQTGFIGGPAILANMARDKWMPSRFALLSDRLVAQNGILLMSGAALFTLFLTGGSVKYLVVLYSINVFITFTISQLGMVAHWLKAGRGEKRRVAGLLVNGTGLIMTTAILVMVVVAKFREGGWITMAITAAVITLALYIKKKYNDTHKMLLRLDVLVDAAAVYEPEIIDDAKKKPEPKFSSTAKTAVVFVNGFNGLGLHTVLTVPRLFGNAFKNFVFVSFGIVDTGNFKGHEELKMLGESVEAEAGMYVDFMKKNGFYAEAFTSVGTDMLEQAAQITPKIQDKFKDPVFFGGQLVFKEDTFTSRMLHNYAVFQLQQAFYHKGLTFVILPIRVY